MSATIKNILGIITRPLPLRAPLFARLASRETTIRTCAWAWHPELHAWNLTPAPKRLAISARASLRPAHSAAPSRIRQTVRHGARDDLQDAVHAIWSDHRREYNFTAGINTSLTTAWLPAVLSPLR